MAIRVGRVIQLSFEPFYIDMERRGVELVDVRLNQVAEAMREGEIDGGPVPLTDSFEMENFADPVAGFCLSSATRSGSNLVYSRVPIEELDGGRVALSEVDPTTVQLLQVLLAKKYQKGAPELVQTADEHDALVISGDAALRRRRGMRVEVKLPPTGAREGPCGIPTSRTAHPTPPTSADPPRRETETGETRCPACRSG